MIWKFVLLASQFSMSDTLLYIGCSFGRLANCQCPKIIWWIYFHNLLQYFPTYCFSNSSLFLERRDNKRKFQQDVLGDAEKAVCSDVNLDEIAEHGTVYYNSKEAGVHVGKVD